MDKKTTNISFSYLVRSYAWPFRKVILLLIFITVLANLITAAQPVALSGIMNIIVRQDDTSVGKTSLKLLDLNQIGKNVMNMVSGFAHDKWGYLLIFAGIYVLLVILSSMLNYGSYLLSLNIENRALKLIQTDLMKHILSLNMGFFNHQKTGDLMSRFNQDARNTASGIGPLVYSFLNNSLLILLYSSYLFSTNALLTVVAFALILTQFGLTEIIKRPIGKTVRRQLDKQAEFSNILHEIFTSVRVIKTFGGEKYEVERSAKGLDNMNKADFKAGVIEHLQEPTRAILDAFAIVGIILIASQQLMKGALSLQGFALFIFVGQLLISPINKLAINVSWIQGLLASYARVNAILQIKPQVMDGHIIKADFDKSIEINKISFSYGNGPVINNVSFEVKKGEIIAIVGPSGAGKSTLVDLILRFYDPSEGNVFIDAINLKEIKYDAYRRIFGVVPQQNILLNDTVKNNIIYGRSYLTDDNVMRAAKVANAHDFIMQLPQGYNTIIGERGVLLSGGQCQRIAIARAVVSKPSILILDEATSSLDSESERQVQTAIDKVLQNSTAIIIAHRLSTILHAHKIIVLQKGKVEAIGTHSELLLKSSTYQLLYNLQFRNVKICEDDEELGSIKS